jgi:hypothetical protein
VRLAPRGALRVTMGDAVWLVIPQWFEGAARRVNADPVARKTFVGTDDRKDPVRLTIEFRLDSIPPDLRRRAEQRSPHGVTWVPGLSVGLSR